MGHRGLAVTTVVGALAFAAVGPSVANDDSPGTDDLTLTPAKPAALAAKKAKTRVRLSIGSQSTNVANKVSATVRVTPAAKRRVQIQTRSATNNWETVQTAKTNAKGRVKTSFTTYRDGDYRVRAVVQKTEQAKSGTSKNATVGTSKSTPLKSTYPGFGEPPKEDLNPVAPGTLDIKKKAASTATLGEFEIEVKRSGKPSVVVTDGAGRVAWSSTPGKAFVTANRSKVRWFQRSSAGAFWAQVDRKARLRNQTVTSVAASADSVVVKGAVKGDGEKARYKLTMTPVQRSADTSVLQMDVSFLEKNSTVTPNSVQLTSARSKNAAVHGFGSQFQPFDLSGQVLPILVQEQGVTRGEKPAADLVDRATWGAGNLQTSYGAWPTYVTEQNRSFELADKLGSGAFGIADMRRAGQVSLESFHKNVRAVVVARDNPKDLMKARAAGSSRPALADWVQKGAVLGIQGGTDKVRKVVADMQAAGTKVAGVWLQDWVGKRVTSFGEQLWWTWQLNEKTYPGWNQMVSDFKAQGIDVLTYINPFVIDQSDVDGTPIRDFYKEGEDKGFLVKNQVGDTYVVETIGFPTALVDLTNPQAREWYADIIATEVLGVGATGFMADFGEYLPFDSVLFKGKALKQHNRWPQLWADTVRQGCQKAGVADCMTFFRSSYLGSPKSVPLMWAGDQMVNFAVEDGLASAIKGMLSGGVSGAPLWHSDVGGYTSVNAQAKNYLRPPDLNARWAEMQAFGPVMRSHETNRPSLNEQVYDTPETRAQFARASKIYAALYDYRKGVVEEGVRDGIPAMRHGWLVFPGTGAAQADLQFFLGDHLLVAPVVEEGGTSVEVAFPPGQWKHILTGEVFSGDTTTTVNAPIGTPAAFVQVGDPVGDQIVNAMKSAGLAP